MLVRYRAWRFGQGAWITVTSFLYAFVGYTPKGLLTQSFWQFTTISDPELPHLCVGRSINDKLQMLFAAIEGGKLGVFLTIADSSALPIDYPDATLAMRSDSGATGVALGRLIRLDAQRLAIVAQDAEGVAAIFSVALTAAEQFELTASCALWTGDRIITVGAKGVAPLIRRLLETSQAMAESVDGRGLN